MSPPVQELRHSSNIAEEGLGPLADNEYVVAIPQDPTKDMEGYQIMRVHGEPYGKRISPRTAAAIVEYMQPFFIEKRHSTLGYLNVPAAEQYIGKGCVVRARFASGIHNEVDIRHREHLVEDMANKWKGDLTYCIADDFVCLFRQPSMALGCAVTLQNIPGIWKIALDYGPVEREVSCSGFRLAGPTLNNCCQLLNAPSASPIVFSHSFVQVYQESNNNSANTAFMELSLAQHNSGNVNNNNVLI